MVQEIMEPVQRLSRDLRQAAITLSEQEVRYLVDYYYIMQEDRKRADNQVRALGEEAEPHAVISWVSANSGVLERSVKSVLEKYAKSKIPGEWAMTVPGIGPIIASGLLAHVNIEMCPTVGKIWRFGGLDPTNLWLGSEMSREIVARVLGSGTKFSEEHVPAIAEASGRNPLSLRQSATLESGKITRDSVTKALAKRPWNARLKLVCFHIGECLIRAKSAKGGEFYGDLFDERKAYEWGRNIAGELSDQAKAKLAKFNIDRGTDAYKWYSGQVTAAAATVFLAEVGDTQRKPKLVAEGKGLPMLPPAHIHSRARRWLTKLFLAHYHQVAYQDRFGELPPKPYVFSRLGHSDFIGPPNWPLV